MKTLKQILFFCIAICLNVHLAYSQQPQPFSIGNTTPVQAATTELEIYSTVVAPDPIITLTRGAPGGINFGALAFLHTNTPAYSSISGNGSLVLHNNLDQCKDIIITTYAPASTPSSLPTYIQPNGGAIRFATHQDSYTPSIAEFDQERMTLLSNGNLGIGEIHPENNLQLANGFTFCTSSVFETDWGTPMSDAHPFIGYNWTRGTRYTAADHMDEPSPTDGPRNRYLYQGPSVASRITLGDRILMQTASGHVGTDATKIDIENIKSVLFGDGKLQVGLDYVYDNHANDASNTLEVNGGCLIGADWVGSRSAGFCSGCPARSTSLKAPTNGLMVEGAVEIGVNTSLDLTVTPHIRPTPDNSTYMLVVNGSELAKEVVVRTDFLPDYVFNDDYKLATLPALNQQIKELHHLPDIPSAAQVADEGLELGKMAAKLLQKIEELTLYAIASDKKVAELAKRIEELESHKQ